MLIRPLEQFEIIPLLPGLTNRTLFTIAIITLLVLFFTVIGINGNGNLVPNRWQARLELYFINTEAIIAEGKSYFPLIFTLFRFLLRANLIGLVPYRFTITSHAIVTLTLALGIWFGKLILGFRLHGFKLFGIFLPAGIPFAIVPFLVAIELLGFLIVAIRLPVRLFANIIAGHILLKVLGGFAWSIMLNRLYLAHFLPLTVLLLLIGLETGVALIQAYVFTILTCLYITDIIHGGH